MDLIITLLLCVIVTNLVAYLLKKICVPHVISLILSGLFFGLPIIRELLLDPNTNVLIVLGDLGILSSMFLAGLHSSKDLLYSERRDSLIISLFAILTPFLLSFSLFYALGFSINTCLIIAVCMSITAEATNTEVLLYLRKVKTKIGSIILEAGILDDIFGLLTFLVVTIIYHEATTRDLILLIGLMVAFFVGLVFQRIYDSKVTMVMKYTSLYALVPFFFVSMGLHFDFFSLKFNPLLLVFIVTLAIVGKLGGTLLATKFTDLKTSQLYLIGWALNSRGAIELVLALIAFRNNFISAEIYSSLIFMSLLSTLFFPAVINFMIEKQPRIMSI